MVRQVGSIAMLAQVRLECRLGPRHYPIANCSSWLNCNFGSSQDTVSSLMIAQAGSIAILAQVRIPYRFLMIAQAGSIAILAQVRAPSGVCVCLSLCLRLRVCVSVCAAQKPAKNQQREVQKTCILKFFRCSRNV